MEKPILLPNPDLTDLHNEVQKYVDAVWEGGFDALNEDSEYVLGRIALYTFFGKSIFDTLNEKDEEVSAAWRKANLDKQERDEYERLKRKFEPTAVDIF